MFYVRKRPASRAERWMSLSDGSRSRSKAQTFEFMRNRANIRICLCESKGWYAILSDTRWPPLFSTNATHRVPSPSGKGLVRIPQIRVPVAIPRSVHLRPAFPADNTHCSLSFRRKRRRSPELLSDGTSWRTLALRCRAFAETTLHIYWSRGALFVTLVRLQYKHAVVYQARSQPTLDLEERIALS